MFGWFKPDWHSGLHFFGCYFLTDAGVEFGFSWLKVVLIVALLGLLWETMDKFLAQTILDKRGGDWVDILFDFGGIGLCLFINL